MHVDHADLRVLASGLELRGEIAAKAWHWWLGLLAVGAVRLHAGRFVSGLRYYRRALEILERLAPDSDELALCEAIVVMAHKLGLKVIAEGIETPAQRDLLIAIGCDLGQGYLFARPMPADALIDRLRSGGEGGVADTLHGPAEDGP